MLRQILDFCRDREWTSMNPAKALEAPRIVEANHVVPYTEAEIIKISAACEEIGKNSYERLRAKVMVLVMRYAGPRISYVVTPSRDDIKGIELEKRALKNRRTMPVELRPQVIAALEMRPRPKAAPSEFSSGPALNGRTATGSATRSHPNFWGRKAH